MGSDFHSEIDCTTVLWRQKQINKNVLYFTDEYIGEFTYW